MRLTRNQVDRVSRSRGFESHPLRQTGDANPLVNAGFFFQKMQQFSGAVVMRGVEDNMEHGGPFLILGIISLIIHIMILMWVYSDAEANGNSGCLWAILVFFFGIWALAIYLIFIRGVSAIPRRSAVDRNMDLQYRSQTRQSPARTPDRSRVEADANYYAPELDRLIELRKFSEARSYLNDMQKMAREMNDLKALANYASYEARISQAARTGSGQSYIPGSRTS